MKKFSEGFKVFSKEETSKIKGGHKKGGKGRKKKKGREAELLSGIMDCPPPEPDVEL